MAREAAAVVPEEQAAEHEVAVDGLVAVVHAWGRFWSHRYREKCLYSKNIIIMGIQRINRVSSKVLVQHY